MMDKKDSLTKKVNLKMTENQVNLLKLIAAHCGSITSEVIRAKLFDDDFSIPKINRLDQIKTIQQLAGACNNLNQIAKMMHQDILFDWEINYPDKILKSIRDVKNAIEKFEELLIYGKNESGE